MNKAKTSLSTPDSSMTNITYPRSVAPEAVFTQETFDCLTSSLFSWRQGPGQIGALHLHACWGETSVLTRRYQGQSIYLYYMLMSGVLRLYEATQLPRWSRLARDIVANLLDLQAPNGGFIHGAAEAEPAYVPEITCPIHQFLPIHVLMDYYAWPHAEDSTKREIRDAIDRHWQWSQKTLWRSGNAWIRPLDFAGWCGVTNQDLVAIASLARYAHLFGDSSRFDQFGAPSLEVYLSPRYWHRKMGLMERGDSENFVERSTYYEWILGMLEKIGSYTQDHRIDELVENISIHLLDAAYQHEDGHVHLSWGAQTHLLAKSSVAGWTRAPLTLVGYPWLLSHLRAFAGQREEKRMMHVVSQIESTLASYVFSDGTIPGAIAAKDPIFSIVTSPSSGSLGLWLFLINRLGTKLQDPKPVTVPRIQRSRGDLRWSSSPRLWRIDRAGRQLFAGLKRNPGAVAIGPDEQIAGADIGELDHPEVIEQVLY